MLSNVVIIALIPGCVEIAKRSGLPSRFAPLAAILFGIILGFLSASASGQTPTDAPAISVILLLGITDGLAAVGLYKVLPTNRVST